MSTPMQQQYYKLKEKYPDCILLFRLGDFYEGFDEDAKILAKILGITLTGRGATEKRTPMAGIPFHSLPQYLPKLVNAGYKVAIAEQLEAATPGKLVEREVVKVITAGTYFDDSALLSDENNYLGCIYSQKIKSNTLWGYSLVDMTTGEFSVFEIIGNNEIPSEIYNEIENRKLNEILVSSSDSLLQSRLQKFNLTKFDDDYLDIADSRKILSDQFETNSLKGFGIEDMSAALISASEIIRYLKDTQKTDLKHLKSITKLNISDHMILDESTIRNLELFGNIENDKNSTLYGVLNKCQTPMGQRLLRKYILEPLKDSKKITLRHECVEELFDNAQLNNSIIGILNGIYDIERLLGKIGLSSANARDLKSLQLSLEKIDQLRHVEYKFNSESLSKIFEMILNSSEIAHISNLIENSIASEPAPTITEGNIIKTGYDIKLDEIRGLTKNGKDQILLIQQKEIQSTGIPSLKIKYNGVFGYYIEISKSNLAKVPDSYIRKQTLVNAERYITEELKEWEEKVLGAEGKQVKMEYEIFCKIRNEIAQYIPILQELSKSISQLDVFTNFAQIARENNYTRPILSEKSFTLNESRHIVVEKLTAEEFIPNDLDFSGDKRIMILTGPNMSGKSTFIRQVALLALISQIGGFVPATKALIPVFDRIFTRVGASDNLVRGESTFMVEMNETANILNNATKDSLIILDEVGRGTSTYDGVALAWSITEYIQEKINCMTLFATHYHELTELEKQYKSIVNYKVEVKDEDNKVIFMRKIIKGGADKSYGIHVAKLAGVPKNVLSRAQEILEKLEDTKQTKSRTGLKSSKPIVQLSFIGEMSTKENSDNKKFDEIKGKILSIDLDNTTPIEALKKLTEFKEILK